MTLKFKLTEDESAIAMNDKGMPIAVDGDGKETPIDAIGLYTQVPELKSEAKKRRETARDLKKELDGIKTKFDGIEDPEAAIKALNTVANLSEGDLVKADEVEALKTRLSEAHSGEIEKLTKKYDKQIGELTETNTGQDATIRKLVISDAFSRSELVRKLEHIPVDMVEATFASNFKVEKVGDRMVPVGYMGGDKLFAKSNPAEPAGFNEALERIIESRPDKDKFQPTNNGGPKDIKSNAKPGQAELKGSQERIAAGLRDRNMV